MVATVTSLPKEGSPLPPSYTSREGTEARFFSQAFCHPWSWAPEAELSEAGQGCGCPGKACEEIHIPEFRISEVSKPPSASSSQTSRYPVCHDDRTGAELECVRGSLGPCTLSGSCFGPPWHLLECLGRKWGVRPGRLLGTGPFYEFQWLFERAGHGGGQVRVGGGFYSKGSGWQGWCFMGVRGG